MISARARNSLLMVVIVACVLCVGVTAAEQEKPSPLAAAKVALRGKQFERAVAALDQALTGKLEHLDEALYLRALALYYAGKHAASVKAADAVIVEHKTSPWFRKARFLKAVALTRQRKFKAAEAIYEAEANRLLSEPRKQKIAGVIIKFADALATKPGPNDLAAPPPNYHKAHQLYRKALEMEIGRALRDEVMFKRARTIQLANNHQQAINDYRAYLAEFDPDWTGNIGSAARLTGRKREKPRPAGKHPLEARYRLGESQLRGGRHANARVNLEDLQKMLAALPAVAGKEGPKITQLKVDTAWELVRTYRLPNPSGTELHRAVKEARDFLEAHAGNPRAVVAAYWVQCAHDMIESVAHVAFDKAGGIVNFSKTSCESAILPSSSFHTQQWPPLSYQRPSSKNPRGCNFDACCPSEHRKSCAGRHPPSHLT